MSNREHNVMMLEGLFMRPAWSYYMFSYQADSCRTFMPIYLGCTLCSELTPVAERGENEIKKSVMACPRLWWSLRAQLLF